MPRKPVSGRSKPARSRTPKRLPPPPTDPTTRYASDVVSGRVVAGRAVRLACQRHLSDLERQQTPKFPYTFDTVRAGMVVEFFRDFLHLEGGKPFVLQPWQVFIVGSVFGWVDGSGARRFRTSLALASTA
jgi:phage terminase large subunit-like protein